MMDVGQVAPKEADPATSMQVDTMILEYLCFNATRGLLGERRATRNGETLLQSEQPDLPLSMIDAFLPIFRLNHSNETPEQSLQLRLRILQFTTLFTRRYMPNKAIPSFEELQALRDTHTRRATAWYGGVPLSHVCQAIGISADQSQFSLSRIRRAREAVCQQLSIPQHASAFYTSPSSVSILDLLPMFLAVAAALDALQGGNITLQLQELAAKFMQQAVLEQYLVFGAQGSELVAEAFAWGYRDKPPTVWDDEELVNDMFCDEDLNQEVDGWTTVHERYLAQLKAPKGKDVYDYLMMIAERSTMADFEDQVLDFLEAMIDALPTPDLTQLEQGQLDDLSQQQTESFKKRVRYYDMDR